MSFKLFKFNKDLCDLDPGGAACGKPFCWPAQAVAKLFYQKIKHWLRFLSQCKRQVFGCVVQSLTFKLEQ